MKLKISFLFFGLLSLVSFSQVQGAPPPCGLTVAYACDDNYDGSEVFNLVEAFPFASFCVPVGESENNYSSIVYYETEADMENETNPITNPTNYTNTSNPQNIYYRVNATTPSAGFRFLKRSDNYIEVLQIPTPNAKNFLTVCDINNNGFNTFDLTESEKGILAGLKESLYSLKYYPTINDAEMDVNALSKTSYVNTVNPQKVYARVSNSNLFSCYTIVELDLIVDNTCTDFGVYLLSNEPPRPGFTFRSKLIVKNHSKDAAISGRIQFNHDPKIVLLNVTDTNVGNKVTYFTGGFYLDVFNIMPKELEAIWIELKTPVNVPLGTKITNRAEYLGTDANSKNNVSTLTETVVGSFDPNDIVESHGSEISFNSFSAEDYLFYTIRFQNVGTADAINVSIDNTLNSKLDKSTIQMLDASHEYVFTRTDNQLNWKFNNIHLPSESMDEPASHGYVYYKIKPKAGYKVADIIPNTAEIYFDFNPAVVTNTFETAFVATLSNKNYNDPEFSIFPNPINNVVTLKFNKNTSNTIQITIFDVQGKSIFNSDKQLINNAIQLNVSPLKSGLYFMKVSDGAYETTKKLLVN